MPVTITPTLTIPDELIEFRAVRASGPGGQNVNKVSNAVELRFDVCNWAELWPSARSRLERLAGRRWSDAGIIVIDAQRLRSQEQNRADAMARLTAMIEQALIEPKPRKKTRPTRASKERRLQGKARDSKVKKLRRSGHQED
jgi:ribosome-associated protein